jgi:hypothetical protein
MFAVVSFIARAPASTRDAEALDGIRQAFFTALARDGSPGVVVAMMLVIALLVVASVRWLRREQRREQRERLVLEEQHQAACAEASAHLERRAWVRVPGHLAMTVVRETTPRPRFDTFETQNIGAGGLAFLAHEPPRTGTRLEFTLDLGERSELGLDGVVVRVDPSPTASTDAASLVAVRFGAIGNAAREHLMKWIAEEEVREIAETRKGRPCAVCGRPLADNANAMHSTCAARISRKAG